MGLLESADNKSQLAGRLGEIQADPSADVLIIGGGINGLLPFAIWRFKA